MECRFRRRSRRPLTSAALHSGHGAGAEAGIGDRDSFPPSTAVPSVGRENVVCQVLCQVGWRKPAVGGHAVPGAFVREAW